MITTKRDCYQMPQENSDIPNDRLLVAEIKNGDPESFKQLYFKYYSALVRFALYRTHSIDIAKETVQDLFCRIWIKRSYLDPDKSVKSYLYKALNNLIINNKNLHSSKNISLNELNRNSASPGRFDNDLALDVRSALERLPEKIRTVYILSRSEGLKYSEIAEICEISEKAVEKRMSKAITFLRKIFSDNYFS